MVVFFGIVAIPLHLRNAVTDLMKQEGYGQGDASSFLLEELKDADFFREEPKSS